MGLITAGQSFTGKVGVAFSQTPAYTGTISSWELATGSSLPAGLSLNGASGLISGTPTTKGSFTASFTGTNEYGTGAATSIAFTITDGVPIITAGQTAPGAIRKAFSKTFSLTDSTNRPVTSWSATGLPSWANINTTTGKITGTPRNGGSTAVTLTATGPGGTSDATTATISIAIGPPHITDGQNFTGKVGVDFMATLALDDALNRPATHFFHHSDGGPIGAFPPGLSMSGIGADGVGMNTTGTITGTPTTKGSFAISLVPINMANAEEWGVGFTAPTSVAFTITDGVPIITAGQTAWGTVGTAFSKTFSLTNSTSRPVTSWSATGLPSWATLNTTTGAITGTTPQDTGSTTISLTATGPGGTSDATTATISIVVGPPIIVAGQNFTGKVGVAFTQTPALDDALGRPATSWSATGLPAGLSLNASTGAITGTPTAKGSFTASFTATNGIGTSAATSIAFTISEGVPIITTSQTASGTVGAAFTKTFSLTDATNRPVTSWSATGLPAGLSINSSTGEISGTPLDISDSIQLTATGLGGTDTETVGLSITVKYIVYALGTLVKKVMYGSTIVKDILSRSTIFWSFTPSADTTITGFRAIFTGAVNLVLDTIQTALTSNTNSNPTVPSNVRGLTLSSPSSVTSITCGTSSPKLGGTIDVSSFPNLTSITCSGNGITKFQGYGSLTNLIEINLSNNELNQVGFETLSNKPGLRTLNFSGSVGNQYINWTGAFPDLSAITTLATVNINNSSLTGSNLNLSALTNLTALSIHSNLLSGAFPILPTGANSKLVSINVGQNKTTRFTGTPPLLTDHPACTSLAYSNNDVTGPIQDLSVRPTLTNFWCSGCLHTGNIPNLSSNTALTVFRANGQRGTTKLTGFAGGTVSATLGDFLANDNQLPAAAVNAILAEFVAAGRVKTATNTCTLNLGGTGNAAPTGQGITDKQTLQARGWTVTTN